MASKSSACFGIYRLSLRLVFGIAAWVLPEAELLGGLFLPAGEKPLRVLGTQYIGTRDAQAAAATHCRKAVYPIKFDL